MAYQSINPATGKTPEDVRELTDKELETKLATAATCFETWKHKTYAERAVIVAKAAALMHDQVEDLAHIMTLEMGKRIDEARGEVEFSSKILAYYAKNAERFLANVEAASDPRRRPYGEQPDRRDLLRRALELSLLPACPRRRSASDGGQRRCW